MKDPAYIIVEGPIGIGKTELARTIAKSLSYELVLEPVEENPFLEKFYIDPEHYAFATQLYFLVHRARKVSQFNQGKIFYPGNVCDFLVEKDRLFAKLMLTAEQFQLYEHVYNSCTRDLPKPDLVIYLQAPVDVLIKRIMRRGRYFERGIEQSYLLRVIDMYAEFFHYYDAAPLLVVNAEQADFRKNGPDYERLLKHIKNRREQRKYFNPSSDLDDSFK